MVVTRTQRTCVFLKYHAAVWSRLCFSVGPALGPVSHCHQVDDSHVLSINFPSRVNSSFITSDKTQLTEARPQQYPTSVSLIVPHN